MEKVELRTADIAAENAAKLAELFPDIVTEVRDEDGSVRHSIDVEALKAHVGDVAEDKRERYQFTWPGKQKARAEAIRPIDKTMRPCVDESVNWDTTENLYIEGDNLDALKILRETYAGKIKMIYIDPPYNTGHDFVYNDDFARSAEEERAESGAFDEEGNFLDAAYKVNNESNGKFHSDWCSMMYPRLVLARDLLSDDGVIFISIDDCELLNLQSICQEVFSYASCFSTICVEMSKTQGMKVAAAQNGQIVKNHEYVLCIAKQEGFASNDRTPLYDRAAPYDSHFDIILNSDGTIGSLVSYMQKSAYWRSAFDGLGLKCNKDNLGRLLELDANLKRKFIEEIAPILYRKNNLALSRVHPEDFPVGIVVPFDGYLVKRNSNGTVEQLQSFQKTLHWSDDYCPEYERTTIRGALWKGFYSDMMNVDKEGEVDFKNGKKPVRLIRQLIKWLNRENGIVLDFFSGSATTAHAVMQLNAEDGGNRKFIMVQLPEVCDEKSEAAKDGYKNICEIGKERIRRAGAKIASEVEESNAQLKLGEEPKRVPDIGFRVLKIDSSNFEDVQRTPDSLFQDALFSLADNVKPGRTPEDILFQLFPKLEIPYTARIDTLDICGKTVYSVDDDTLVACFDREVPEDVVRAMAQREPAWAVLRDASFTGDDALANFEEIFKTVSPETKTRVV